jgi:arylsulfatase A-like enzyme
MFNARSRLLLLWVALAAGAARAEAPRGRTNVVVILADDLGWADLGCYGSKFHRTPALDRLAAAGLRFTDAYASCPVCSPTRAALMTGKVPARLGLTDWFPGRPDRPDQPLARPPMILHLPLEETTLAEAFKAAGYVTGHIGKWHLGGKWFEPTAQGFDVNVAGDQTGTPRSYFAPFRNKLGVMPGLDKAPDGEYLTDRLAAEAERFIEKHKDKPFFLYLPHHAVHTPLRAKPELVKKYPAKAVPGKQSNAVYAAMLESLDEAVGRVVAALEKHKLTDRTIIVFTSDNGGLATREGMATPATINAPLREGKGWLYEGGIRVPLLVRWPGVVKAGGTSAVPVITHDLFPTLLEACGVERKEKVDGDSLVSLLRGKGGPAARALYWHYPHYANQGSRPGGAVREGDWKLIEFYEHGRRELFDLKASVGEQRNLAAEKPDVVKRLSEKLEAWRKGVRAEMPRPNPNYRPNPQDDKGVITLHARTARVHGAQLRYEPLPHKDTLGYWTEVGDHASWQFTVTKAGAFTVEVLQGCGKGQGGSEVGVEAGGKVFQFTVEDTGGFQNFKARAVGTVTIAKAGRHTLTVRPRSKAKAAVMDLRQIVLRPAGAVPRGGGGVVD